MHKSPVLEIYRSVFDGANMANRLLRTDSITRPPVKIPFVVDNLWEWARPEKYPSRRLSSFASPQIRLAKKQGPPNGEVYRIEFPGRFRICQLKEYQDATHHPECISLSVALFEKLGNGWLKSSMQSKDEAGRLWLPVLKKEEVDALFEQVQILSEYREELRASIHFWEDVELIDPEHPRINEENELFFEAPDGYYLRPVTSSA